MPEYDSTVRYKTIEGFPNYMIGSDGSVWSNQRTRGLPWRKLSPGTDTDGYKHVVLRRDNKSHLRKVHQLVLESFVGPRPDGMVCRHFPDRTRSNNDLDNLSWGTPKQNTADMIIQGTAVPKPKGEACSWSKLTADDVREIREAYATGNISQRELGERKGVSQTVIGDAIRGTSWGHVT